MASRRGSEELIFGGKVTVNGSVCTSPQVILVLFMLHCYFFFLKGFGIDLGFEMPLVNK